jgi:dihydroorotase
LSSGEPERFDVVLRGGTLVDPATGSRVVQDVAVRGGKVARIEEHVDFEAAVTVVDVDGMLVTPGLIDLHVHAYPGGSVWGMNVDDVSLRSGVTTVVDAGSAGAANFEGLEAHLRNARVRSRAFLNLATIGLAGRHGELLSLAYLDEDAAIETALRFPERIIGFKLRASPNTVGGNARAALEALRRVADATGLEVMVHVSEGPPKLGEILGYLRASDILTHCFTPYDNGVIGEDGVVVDEVLEALERGVLLDVGHGSGSFSFAAAERFVASGLPLPIVSTDLHRASALGPAFDLSTVMTKMLAAGASFDAVLEAVTTKPAAVVGMECALREGSVADIAVLVVEDRALEVWDSRGNVRRAPRRVACRLTVLGGEVVFAAPEARVRRGRYGT